MKEIVAQDEKLLRRPTVREKKNGLRPIILIIVLLLTVVLGALFITQKENQALTNMNKAQSNIFSSSLQRSSGIGMNRQASQTYVSTEGKYSIKYPSEYSLKNLFANPGGIMLTSNKFPGSNMDFSLTVSYKEAAPGQILTQLIDQNPVCENMLTGKSVNVVINGVKQAKLYADINCGQNLQSVIYTMNNNIFYIFTVKSQAKFSEVKPNFDKLMSELKFSNESPFGKPK